MAAWSEEVVSRCFQVHTTHKIGGQEEFAVFPLIAAKLAFGNEPFAYVAQVHPPSVAESPCSFCIDESLSSVHAGLRLTLLMDRTNASTAANTSGGRWFDPDPIKSMQEVWLFYKHLPC